jgi:hypothetical protein
MANGVEMEGIVGGLIEMVRPPKRLKVTIGIIDPGAMYVAALASYFDLTEKELTLRMESALQKLWSEREKLSAEERARFRIKVYSAIPVASVIILDAHLPTGRVQLDIKAYKVPRHDSFAFELAGPEAPLYIRCRDAWLRLLEDSPDFTPAGPIPNTPTLAVTEAK